LISIKKVSVVFTITWEVESTHSISKRDDHDHVDSGKGNR